MGFYNYLMLLNSYAINFYLILTLSATLIVDVFILLRLDNDIEFDRFEYCKAIADSMNGCDYELKLIINFEEQSARFF